MSDPDPRDLVRCLRVALGWPDVALPISPQQAWEDAVVGVADLLGERNRLQVQVDYLERIVARYEQGGEAGA